jgi:asparagine synthetase B (glutamine-hydrolysing)
MLVQAIGDCVKQTSKPAVNISGGIDSTIVLHHLHEKTEEPIWTYTVGFTDQETEFAYAQQVADHYNTVHHEVVVDNMLERYPEILRYMDAPRFNLWPWWVAEKQAEDGRLNCYIGEGGDEQFGGYWYKPKTSYVQAWTHLFQYVDPTYQQIYDHFNITLHKPLHPECLDWRRTFTFYDSGQEKLFLKKAYRGIIPDFVLDRKKLNGRKDYWVIWRKELAKIFPYEKPETEHDIIRLLNIWTTKTWLNTRLVKAHKTIPEPPRV